MKRLRRVALSGWQYAGLKASRCRLCNLLVLVGLVPAAALAQTNPAALAARQWRQQHERAIVDEFITLLAIPNIAKDQTNITRNAAAIASMMERRGIATKLVSVPGANPVVFGEIRAPGATRTIAFYAHYDGQPLDPKEWATPPFEPVLRNRPIESGGTPVPWPAAGTLFDPESRLYARAAADDKAPIVAMMTAVDAIRAAGLQTTSNIKFAFEGEEEASSIHLEEILSANRELFAADLWLICDGPVHQTRRQSIVFGARGIAAIDLTVYGPRVELHSGHYGNWAPNPAMLLVQLLASMKNERGRVLVDRFYDGIEPLSATEKRAVADAPDVDAELMREFWLGATENPPRKLADLITVPSLNIRGMSSSRTGEQASNVIPASATAAIDIRLVKGMDRHRTTQLLIEHVRKQGFFVVDAEPSAEIRMAHPRVARVVIKPGGYNSVRTSMDLPISQEVIRVVESVRGATVKIPNSGASVPLDMIERALGTRTIGVPIANHDDNQHSFDENLRLQNLWDGIELMAALLAM
jgi:acetylornithine deacetylase/succinyl-diaminopimelate desuccinylase-like protein